ncbi:MAG: 1-acyl-sn-glycerol-3-phosphate acyltransferase [Deltaproteobacteria bacterium]|nr:1-acyl-sn-glycerol-3-phosphate acyltransferase [Deltaproteobacteria bacterium]
MSKILGDNPFDPTGKRSADQSAKPTREAKGAKQAKPAKQVKQAKKPASARTPDVGPTVPSGGPNGKKTAPGAEGMAKRASKAAAPVSPALAGSEPEPDLTESAPSAPVEVASSSPEVQPLPEEHRADLSTSPIAEDLEGIDIPPDTVPPDEALDDEVFFGEEAAPPPGDYGPGLDVRKELPYQRRSITEEVREPERRVRARLTPAFPIEHRRKLPLEFLWRWYRDIAMRDRSDVVDEFGRDPLYASRVEPLLEFLYKKYFRVNVVGLENVPDHGRALLVSNHSGTLPYDGAMIMHAVRRGSPVHRDVRPLVEDFVFHFPYLGTFINRIGGVRACQENAERLLNQDQLVAVFPEGIKGIGKLYKERYRLQRFGRGGFIKLALRTGAPIIPTAVIGAEEIHPMVAKITWLAKSFGIPYLPVTPTFPWLGPLGALPLPTKWTIRFGKPLDYGQRFGPTASDDRILVNKLSDTVRSTIQEMIDDVLAQRKSVLLG